MRLSTRKVGRVSEPSLSVPRLHQIGEVSDATGLSIRTIRHYDDVGLVPPSGHTTGGFRLYTDGDIERLQLVKLMKPLEFTLEEMSGLLRALDQAQRSSGEPRDPRIAEQLMMYANDAEARCVTLRNQVRAGETLVRTLREHAMRDIDGVTHHAP